MGALRILGALILAATLLAGSKAKAAVLITVNKAMQQMTVSVDGVPRWTWPVSTGIARYDTPDGTYGPLWMAATHFSKEWDDAPMPHSIFFTSQGHAIHGSLHSRLGRPASHGCVRLTPKNAAKLFDLVKEQGLAKTKIVIEGEIPRTPAVAMRKPKATGKVAEHGRERASILPTLPGHSSSIRPDPQPYAAPRARALPEQRPPHRSTNPASAYTYRGLRVYYGPRAAVYEYTFTNGMQVRRYYYRAARPRDFGWYR